ncbi:mannitol dehydrogenase [Alsobacter metallidurans]|uniref:Mannitol dehydrogenase n=1 Tax=Alsobacter metallidurans TaxID=340221 RepID=A0A917I7U0_9HYPH|nr:mannitol dehydrogenase family protein [Alsobacter metallidurans]GGH22189.1 mannitol dehydrogenase [Alsobacter metallidurans]
MTVLADLPRLSPATLTQLKPGVALPGYDRDRLRVGIVHLGLGAFVRAHGMLYTDDALAQDFAAWGYAGVSLKRPDQRDRLAPQGGLYTALRRDSDGVKARIVGNLKATLVAPEDPEAVVAMMADAAARIVSLTITEKGYCHDPATGQLDEHHADIRHDLENHDAPRTAVGIIVEALERRRVNGIAPFTVLCCDNLPHNGQLVSGLVRDFAALRDTGLAAWIEAHGAFPSTMVDRIVPATTQADIDAAAEATGLYDAAPVTHEPFRQWVIEDAFVDGARPAWHKAGAQIVADVAPYEHMKLRLLNGSHSALAYLGYLAGCETVVDAVSNPALRAFVKALWREEVIPAVPAPAGVDLGGYADDLLERFSNSSIRHRTWQIAMDGSQKLPQRILATIRDRLDAGLPFPRLALAVAAWIRYVGGVDERGQPIDVRDPLAQTLRQALDQAGQSPAARVAAMLRQDAIFGADLPHAPAFVQAVTDAYAILLARGAVAAAGAAT